jgi:hypothetical protein
MRNTFSSIYSNLRNKARNNFGEEGEKIFDSAVVALTSDVAANFVLWSVGFGPAYYGLKCVGFTFLNATFKYYIREKINDYLDDNYYLKHLTAGAVGGGSYYGFNYLFKVHMEDVIFSADDLKIRIFNGIINNSIWEFSSDTLNTIKKEEEWVKYTAAAYTIEVLDCFFGNIEDMAECLIKKQPIGAISRAMGAYYREDLKVGIDEYQKEKNLGTEVGTNDYLHQDL